jgi:GT2 family glycosyltransferase
MDVEYDGGVMNTCLVVVVPTYHAGKLLDDAIRSIRFASILSTLDVKIIVVDNSVDSSDCPFSAEADVYYPMPSNPGFGTAVNKGIEIACEKYDFGWILLLNPDAKLDKNFFRILSEEDLDSLGKCGNPVMPLICFDKPIHRLKTSYLKENGVENFNFLDPFDQYMVFSEEGRPLEHHTQGQKTFTIGNTLCVRIDNEISRQLIYSNTSTSSLHLDPSYRILNFDEDCLIEDYLVQNAGSEIHSPYSAGDLLTGYLASSVKSHFGGPRRAWCGAGVLLPKNYIKIFGGFDPSFFLYYEDTELSHRAIASDFLPLLMPKLQIFHKHSAITSQNNTLRSKSIWQSRSLFVVRTRGLMQALFFSLGILVRAVLLVIRKRTTLRHFVQHLFPEFFHSFVGVLRSVLNRKGPKIKCE